MTKSCTRNLTILETKTSRSRIKTSSSNNSIKSPRVLMFIRWPWLMYQSSMWLMAMIPTTTHLTTAMTAALMTAAALLAPLQIHQTPPATTMMMTVIATIIEDKAKHILFTKG